MFTDPCPVIWRFFIFVKVFRKGCTALWFILCAGLTIWLKNNARGHALASTETGEQVLSY
jgi:hypothetical protein